jgi:hypothetical protein
MRWLTGFMRLIRVRGVGRTGRGSAGMREQLGNPVVRAEAGSGVLGDVNDIAHCNAITPA